MKKYFITGLVILLPVALTLSIVIFLFNLLTEPFVGVFKTAMDYYGVVEPSSSIFFSEKVQEFLSQMVILVLLFLFTVGLGILASWFFFHYLVRFWEWVMKKIPVVNSIYQTCKEVIHSIFASKTNSFKQVVLVPFPTARNLMIGFVTNDQVSIPGFGEKKLVSVFVPTTPNPSSGFLMMVDSSDLIYLDIKVEDAFKYVISCGTLSLP